MLLVSHLRTSLLTSRCFITASKHHIKTSSVNCDLSKPPFCDERAKTVGQQQASRRRSECLEVKSTLGHVGECHGHQVCPVVSHAKQDSQASPTHNWLPRNPFRGKLLDGLFHDGRREISALLKQSFLSLRHLGPAFHPSSAGYCTITPKITYFLNKTRLGHTYSVDLSPSDQEKLKTLAYKELKTILKDNKIKYKKAQKKKTPSTYKSLDALAAFDIKSGTITTEFQVPITIKILLDNVCESCATENIFKTDSEASKVKNLTNDIEEKSKDPNYSIPEGYSAHDAATAVKTVLNSSPVRLMTTEKVDEYPDMSSASEEIQRKFLNLFILSMSQPHRDTLHMLLRTLYLIDKDHTKSRMDADRLASLFAPLLFKMPEKLSDQEQSEKMKQFVQLTKLLIWFHQRHLYVDKDLLDQLRALRVKEKPKASSPKLARKAVTLTEASLLVSAPSMPKTSLDIKIAPETSAYEVVESYRDMCYTKRESVPKSNNCLFEVGGNIGERCLDPFAFILDVHHANPTAAYVIRPSSVKNYFTLQSYGYQENAF